MASWEILANCGFLREDPLEVGGISISPVEFTTALLNSQEQFHYQKDELDLTLLRIEARGIRHGEKTRIIYQLIDHRDRETGFTSMQRTVGFMMGIGARLILEGKLSRKGLLSPLDVPIELIVSDLERYRINITRQELPWNGSDLDGS